MFTFDTPKTSYDSNSLIHEGLGGSMWKDRDSTIILKVLQGYKYYIQ